MQNILVTAGIITKGEKVLIAQRHQDCHLANKWEFPGGKVEEGEEPEEALKRELKEELELEVEVGDIAAVISQKESRRNIILLYYHCYIVKGTPKAVDCQDVKWVYAADLLRFDFAPADLKMVQKLLRKVHA